MFDFLSRLPRLPRLTNYVERLTGFSYRAPWRTLFVLLVLAAASAAYAAASLKINTEQSALFDAGLPFRGASQKFYALFPDEDYLILIVLDGPSPALAEQAAGQLAGELQSRTDLFHRVRRPTGGSFFAHNGLLYVSMEELDVLAARLTDAQPLLGALTADLTPEGLLRLTGKAAAHAGESAGLIDKLSPAMNAMAGAIDAAINGTGAPLNWADLLNGPETTSPATVNDRRRFILANPIRDLSALAQGGTATDFIRLKARELGVTPANGFRLRLTGEVPLADEELSTIAEGTGFAGLIATCLVTLLLLAAFRSVTLIASVLFILFLGLIVTGGWATLAVGELNMISVAFAVMFVGIGVDFAIQFTLCYLAERRALSEHNAIQAATRSLAGPLTIAASAAALGFFSFFPTSYRGVAQLGLIASGGILIALFMTLAGLPALIALFHPRPSATPAAQPLAPKLDRLIARHRIPILAAAGILGVAALAALPYLSFDFDPLKLKDPKTESFATLQELMTDPWATPYTMNVLAPDAERAQALAGKLTALPEVANALTIASFVPENQDDKLTVIDDLAFMMEPTLFPPPHGSDQPATPGDLYKAAGDARGDLYDGLQNNTLPAGARDAAGRLMEALNQLLTLTPAEIEKIRPLLSKNLLDRLKTELAALRDALSPTRVTLDNLPEDLKTSWIATDGRHRVQLYPAGNPSDIATIARFDDAVRTARPDAIGTPTVIIESSNIVINAFITAAAFAVLSIIALLAVVLRRPADVACAITPLVLASALTLGGCALIGFPVNFANIIALPLLLGIGVTFPIYLVTRWRAGEAAALASVTARAVLYSALTTMAAFGSLALSDHPGTASLGLLLLIALTVTIFATLIVLPALLGPAPQKDQS